MKLLILDGPQGPRASKAYRGTYRRHPFYCASAPESDEINRLFFWFIDAGGQLGVVDDLQRATRYANLLNTSPERETPVANFEIVEVTDGALDPQTQGRILGVDLSSGYNNSLLWAGLTSHMSNFKHPIWDAALPRWTDFRQTFVPKLNRYGLFEREDDAVNCLRQMIAIQSDFPDFFEGGDLKEFAPTGIYKVT